MSLSCHKNKMEVSTSYTPTSTYLYSYLLVHLQWFPHTHAAEYTQRTEINQNANYEYIDHTFYYYLWLYYRI